MFSPNLATSIILVLRGMLVLPNALGKIQIEQIKSLYSSFLGPRPRVTADTLGESNLLNVETQVKQLRLNHVLKNVL